MKIIDLSHPIFDKMPVYPSDPEVKIVKEKEIQYNRSDLHTFSMGTHTGTHLDAPSHIINNGNSIDDIPLKSFIGRALKVDLSSYQKVLDFNEDLDGVVLNTGWYNKYKNPKIYFGKTRPKIPVEFIELLVEKGIKFFCCDLPSVDQSGSTQKPIHNILLNKNVVIYESLTNLGKLPSNKIFNFIGFPLSFIGLDGSPVRAVAIIE